MSISRAMLTFRHPLIANNITQITYSSKRWKTTRPTGEWNDIRRWNVRFDPDQIPTPETPKSREEWTKAKYRGRSHIEAKVHSIATDETRRSDIEEARIISDAKLNALKQSLLARGFAREARPYQPPDDAQDRVKESYQELLEEAGMSDNQDWLDLPLSDHKFKFNFLLLCASKFDGHLVPNSDLYQIKTIRDVVDFYCTPVRGITTYDKLIRDQNQDHLPPNLHMIKDAMRYDPNSSFMKGIDAYPGMRLRPRSLTEKKTWPQNYKQSIRWPDI